MNIEDLAFLADHASTIDGRRPERLAEVRERIRIARRRRAAGAIAGTSALAAAVVAIAAVVPRSGDNSGRPIEEPTLSTVSPLPEPAGQTEIVADFGPGDLVHDMVPIGSAKSDPGGPTELHASLPYYDTPYAAIVGYCRANSDTWWVATGTYGQCSPTAALEAPPPKDFQPLGNAPSPLPEPAGDQEFSADMWLTTPLSGSARHCIATRPDSDLTFECLQSNDVTVVKDHSAAFGFAGYVHSAPRVVDDPFGIGFEALASLDRTEYEFTRGVVSAPDADMLTAYLDVSDQPRLLLLVAERGPVEAALVVDGDAADFPDIEPGSPWHWGFAEVAARAVVPPGSHNVTVDIPRGAKSVALLVYEADAQPAAE